MFGKRNKTEVRDSAMWLGNAESLDNLAPRFKLQPDDVELLRQILESIPRASLTQIPLIGSRGRFGRANSLSL